MGGAAGAVSCEQRVGRAQAGLRGRLEGPRLLCSTGQSVLSSRKEAKSLREGPQCKRETQMRPGTGCLFFVPSSLH